MSLPNRRIVVAGGAGFLGYHLCERLLGDGCEVVCVDNLQTGSERNVQSLAKYDGFQFLKHDVVEPLRLDADVDQIFNLACPASPPRYQVDPIKTLKTSVYGTLNLLELARGKSARFLQASTSEIYGDPLVHPQREDYHGNVNPIGIRACYDEGKRAGETAVYDYNRSFGLPVRVARIFNTYGPRMDPFDGRVVSNFIVQALRGKDITIYGDGTQTRSFCYCDDLIEGLIQLMNAGDYATLPVNLGNSTEFTVGELAAQVLELTGSKSSITYLPMPQDDPKRRRPNIDRATALLGWTPDVPLREGLLRTISHFSGNLDLGDFATKRSQA